MKHALKHARTPGERGKSPSFQFVAGGTRLAAPRPNGTIGTIDSRNPEDETIAMDLDDLFSSKPGDPLVLLAKQDLVPMSQDELADRIVSLEAEVARTRTHRDAAERHRSQADELFKR